MAFDKRDRGHHAQTALLEKENLPGLARLHGESAKLLWVEAVTSPTECRVLYAAAAPVQGGKGRPCAGEGQAGLTMEGTWNS